jgi:hypothetical protein
MLKKVIIGAVSLILIVAIYADSLPTPEENTGQTRASADTSSKPVSGSSLFGGSPATGDRQARNFPSTDAGVVKIRTADEVAPQDFAEPAPDNGDGTFGQPMVSPEPVLPSNQVDNNGLVNGEIPSDSEF